MDLAKYLLMSLSADRALRKMMVCYGSFDSSLRLSCVPPSLSFGDSLGNQTWPVVVL